MLSQDIIIHTLETVRNRLLRLETRLGRHHNRLLRLETDLGMHHVEVEELSDALQVIYPLVIKTWNVKFDGTMDHMDRRRANDSGAYAGNSMLRLVKISENRHILEYSNGNRFIYQTRPFWGNPNSVFDTSINILNLHIHGFYGGAGSLSTEEKFAVHCPDGAVFKFFVIRQ